MGAFEFENPIQLSARNCGCNTNNNCNSNGNTNCNNDVTYDECCCKGEISILAPKIFDQCRIKKCLTANELGPARMARPSFPQGHENNCDGEIIIPPTNATDVTIRDFELSSIEVLQKKPSPLQDGCWDISLKYVFTYGLEFRRLDGSIICVVEATNSYILKVTLFGGTQGDITTISELEDLCSQQKGKPCVYAEGKAIGLDAELKYPSCGCGCNSGCGCNNGCNDGCSITSPIAVDVTIGLFTIVKLYRTVSVVVESLGTIVPEACTGGGTPANVPCDSFNRLPFPLDLFTPSNETKSCCGYGDLYGSSDCEYATGNGHCHGHNHNHDHDDCGCHKPKPDCCDNDCDNYCR